MLFAKHGVANGLRAEVLGLPDPQAPRDFNFTVIDGIVEAAHEALFWIQSLGVDDLLQQYINHANHSVRVFMCPGWVHNVPGCKPCRPS
jgi:hypothetical protein